MAMTTVGGRQIQPDQTNVDPLELTHSDGSQVCCDVIVRHEVKIRPYSTLDRQLQSARSPAGVTVLDDRKWTVVLKVAADLSLVVGRDFSRASSARMPRPGERAGRNREVPGCCRCSQKMRQIAPPGRSGTLQRVCVGNRADVLLGGEVARMVWVLAGESGVPFFQRNHRRSALR